MTKKILLNLFVGILLMYTSNAQDIVPDSRIVEAFGQEKTNQLLQDDPNQIIYYNFYLENAYFITQPKGKAVSNAVDIFTITYLNNNSKYFDEDISILCKENFNPLKYNFERDFHGYTHYKLGETGKYIVFKPVSVFNRELEAYKNQIN
jgi:hypothetical protein